MPTLKLNSDNTIELQGLTNEVTDAVITSATVTVTLKDEKGNNVTGETWPLSMPHISAGTYRTTLSDSLPLDTGQQYTATIVADNGAGQHREWCVTYSVECN